MSASEKAELEQRLTASLNALHEMRGRESDPQVRAAHARLREYQAQRLRATYPDLLADARYRQAAEFFLSDLYGGKDPVTRDEAMARVVPLLVRMLPLRALETITEAVELDALSEALDASIVACLKDDETITPQAYSAAYLTCGRRADRERQVALIGRIGRSLEKLTKVPLLESTLRLMRGPAQAAGLGELQDFLERGFSAFKKMGSADYFLTTIINRETRTMEQMFAGAVDPIGAHRDAVARSRANT